MVPAVGPDWVLWFAYMEDVPANFSLDFSDEQLDRLKLAHYFVGQPQGASTVSEYLEMVLWEMFLDVRWLRDLDTIIVDRLAPCFFCDELTNRVDIGFEAPFCGSGICNWAIGEDLRMLTPA